MKLTEQEWNYIEKKVIMPLWKNTYKHMYESLKLDYSDFISLAGVKLTEAMNTYDPEKSNLYTFATGVLNRKAKSELRDCATRDVRAALYGAESLNLPISEDNDSEKIEFVSSPQVQDNSNINKIQEYLTKLSSSEKDIIILKVLGFDDEDIVDTLGISKAKYHNAMRSMKIYEKASILRNRYWRENNA